MVLFISFPLTPVPLIYPGCQALSEKKGQKKFSEKKKEKSRPAPQSSLISFQSLSLSLSLRIPKSFSSHSKLFSPPPLSLYRRIYSLAKRNLHIISSNPRILEREASMQPRRSRFTELIDIPSPESTSSSSSSELSLDDVLRETEEHLLASQNRVLSFWNGWDHAGSEVQQRRNSRPRSRLRKKSAGESSRKVLGPSKGPWFWATTWVIFQKDYDEVKKRRLFDGEPIQDSIAPIFLDGRELLNSSLSPLPACQFRCLCNQQMCACVWAAPKAPRGRLPIFKLRCPREKTLTLLAWSSVDFR